MEGAEIAGICDLSRPALECIGTRYPNVPLFTSFDELVNAGRPDAVVIVTPAGTHAALARSALEHGLSVLVEKPLATGSYDARILTGIAEKRGLVLMAGHTFLYSNYVRTVKRLLEERTLGKLRYLYSQRLSLGQVRSDVDVLWNLGPHDVSIANYLIGALPLRAAAWGLCTLDTQRGLSDVVFGRLDYPGGVPAYLHLSWLDPRKVRRMVLVGTEKMLVYDDTDTNAPIRIHDKAAVKDEHGRFTTKSGSSTTLSVELPEPLGIELAHFISCIRTGARPLTDGRHALGVIAVLEALSASLAQGGTPIDISVPGYKKEEC
jgi:predicted dehydrogenase